MNNSILRYTFEENSETKEIIFKSNTDSISKKFTCNIFKPNYLKLNSHMDNNEITIQLKKFLNPVLDFLTENFIRKMKLPLIIN
jgi:hypothetical protein